MEFGFTAEEQAFAEEVRAFLRVHPVESFPEDGMDAGYGSGPHSRSSRSANAADSSSMKVLLSRIKACGAMVVIARTATGLSGLAKSKLSNSGTPSVRLTKM